MFPLCLAKTLDFLKYPSMLGVLSMVYMMGVLVADYAMYGPKNDAVIDKKPRSIVDLFNALPTIILGYQCMTNGYPVFGSFSSPRLSKYLVSILGSVIIMTSIYLPVATFGYLKNGQGVSGNILLDYDSSDNKVLVAQIAVLIAVMMSYPTLFSITRVSINKVWVKLRRLDEDTDNCGVPQGRRSWVRRYSIAVLHFVITLAVAIFLPNISVAASFTGSLSTFFYFIFPGLFMIQSTYVNEKQQFVYPKDSKSKHNQLDRNSFGAAFEEWEDNSTSSQEERIREIDRQTSNKKAFIYDEHLATQSEPYSQRYSVFMRNKYRNGAVSWTMRVTGTFFCAFGLFVFGLGVANAVMSVHNSEPSNIECPN
ncbi:sodium-coupled neutral amino acid transporter 7-like [Convolutriloba macropyga]|uniref:sodium-coupled neutral amino acid transporter 7-like n=1 Tax=Convolutriloba macropyga TaxID=536237 RepID=UPI003F521184